jgi:thiol:disulfide interchange protein DsbD
MSVPLLLVGASAGALLPKAGAWMNDVKHVFGVLLLAVAVWTIQPVLPAALALALWGALLLGSAIMLFPSRGGVATAGWTRKVLAGLLAAFGLLQLIGAASGGTDPLQPLAHLRGSRDVSEKALPFVMVRSVGELDAALQTAQQQGKAAMLDFYADWCVSCKEMERFTFSDPSIRSRLSKALLLKADVTANSPEDVALLKRFQLFGPPGTIFFDGQGQELRGVRVIGFQNAEKFGSTLDAAGI